VAVSISYSPLFSPLQDNIPHSFLSLSSLNSNKLSVVKLPLPFLLIFKNKQKIFSGIASGVFQNFSWFLDQKIIGLYRGYTWVIYSIYSGYTWVIHSIYSVYKNQLYLRIFN